MKAKTLLAGARARLGLDRLSHRDRRALLLGATVVVPALLWAAVVEPYTAALREARAAYEAEYALWERETALLAAAGELPARLDSATAAASAARSRLVRAANEALAEEEVIRYLTLVATTNRVLLQEARGTDVAVDDGAAGGLRPVRLAVRGESDLRGVMTFLRSVEQSPMLLRVAGLTVSPASARSSREERNGVLEFGVLIEAYSPAGGAP